MKRNFIALGFAVWASATPAEHAQLAWNDLVDASAQAYDDPYLDLSVQQLEDLVAVAQLRQLVATGDSSASNALDEREAALTEAGLDTDWLISQRWVVAKNRERAANAGNATLDNIVAVISGFAIPAPPEPDGTPAAYLVEERGLCSHMPPPAPNQMIRVRLESGWTPDYVHQPVRLTGRLSLDTTEQVFTIVDGPVNMKASWRMEAEQAEDLFVQLNDPAGSGDWVTNLKAKLKTSASAEDG